MKKLTIAILAPFLASASVAEPLYVCPGTYEGSWGNVTLSASGTMMLAGTPGSTAVTLTPDSCDAVWMSADGQTMTLTRQGPDHFQGTLAGGGATRVFDFYFATPAQATGMMVAQGGGLQGNRGMTLRLIDSAGAVDPACFDESEVQAPPSPDAEAAALWAQGQGLSPAAGRQIGDYVRADATYDPRHETVSRRASFDLGLDGEILPSPSAVERSAAYCDPDLFLNPPRQLLNFKIFDVAPGVTVFAQIIDIETGRITAQAEGQADGTGADAIAAAMSQASTGLGAVPIGPMTDGLIRR